MLYTYSAIRLLQCIQYLFIFFCLSLYLPLIHIHTHTLTPHRYIHSLTHIHAHSLTASLSFLHTHAFSSFHQHRNLIPLQRIQFVYHHYSAVIWVHFWFRYRFSLPLLMQNQIGPQTNFKILNIEHTHTPHSTQHYYYYYYYYRLLLRRLFHFISLFFVFMQSIFWTEFKFVHRT